MRTRHNVDITDRANCGQAHFSIHFVVIQLVSLSSLLLCVGRLDSSDEPASIEFLTVERGPRRPFASLVVIYRIAVSSPVSSVNQLAIFHVKRPQHSINLHLTIFDLEYSKIYIHIDFFQTFFFPKFDTLINCNLFSPTQCRKLQWMKLMINQVEWVRINEFKLDPMNLRICAMTWINHRRLQLNYNWLYFYMRKSSLR